MKRLVLALVALLPRAFRRQFGEEIREQVERDYARAAAQGRMSLIGFVVATAADLAGTAVVERCRPTWLPHRREDDDEPNGRTTMGHWLRDLTHAARALARARGFTIVAVCTLGVALGVNAAIFGVADTVLLKALPFRNPEDLVVIRGTTEDEASGTPVDESLPEEFYLQFRESPLLAEVATSVQFTSSLRIGDETERARMAAPSTNLFETLGAAPTVGRLPTHDDSRRVALLSYDFWTSRFGSDPTVIGRTIFASGADVTVIGVMGPDFFYPSEGVLLWLPIDAEPADVVPDVVNGGYDLVARLAPGASHDALVRNLQTLAQRIPERFGGSATYVQQIRRFRPLVSSIREDVLGPVTGPIWILFAAVLLVLAIACVNVTNLFLVRAEDRTREIAVRRALGAGRGRLVGALLGESVIIAALAGGLAVALAWLGLPLVVAAAPPGVPRLSHATIGPATLAFVGLASLVCALACGLLPALRFSAPDLGKLRDGSRGSTRRRHLLRDGLVAGQAALALVLLIGAGLLLQSFRSLRNVDPGYDTKGLFTFQIAPESEELFDGPSYASFHEAFMERLRALPGVEAAGVLENIPLDEGVRPQVFRRAEDVGGSDPGVVLNLTFASGEVFGTMGIDLLEGRTFGRDEMEPGLANVIVSRSTAELLWPGQSPIGRRIASESSETVYTVVGEVEDILQYNLRDKPLPMLYFPLVGPTATSWMLSSPGYVVRTRRAESIEPEIRALVHEVAPSAPMYRVHTMADLVADSMVELTFTMLMLAIVSGMALILGAIGLYGTLSYVVSQRAREIGVRMALGARAERVRRAVVAQGAGVVLVGIVAGLAIAAGTTRLLGKLLFGVGSADARTFLAMSATLLLVGALASYLPARRASSVDPAESLRGE